MIQCVAIRSNVFKEKGNDLYVFPLRLDYIYKYIFNAIKQMYFVFVKTLT